MKLYTYYRSQASFRVCGGCGHYAGSLTSATAVGCDWAGKR